MTIPEITQYGVYMAASARRQARDLAVAWLDRYLQASQTAKAADALAAQPVSR